MKDSDCFIFIILTHGDEKGVCGIDGISVPVTTLTEMFEPNNCPELNEKPKIFLIQACRGGELSNQCFLLMNPSQYKCVSSFRIQVYFFYRDKNQKI